MTRPRSSHLRHLRHLRHACALALAASIPFAASFACSDDGEFQNRVPPKPDAGADACAPADTPCPVEFTYPLNGETSVELRGNFAPGAWENGVKMAIEGLEWRTSVAVPNGTAVEYKFFVNGKDWVNDPRNPNKAGDNSVTTASCGALCPFECPTVGTFDWRSAVMYFVFVDRFRNADLSNDFRLHDEVDPGVEGPADYQGGDYAGLLEKIQGDYFNDLGVNTLWLTVPMNNPNVPGPGADGHLYSGYHGYWPTDLDKVEEHFGDMALLKTVVDEAHKKGLKVIVDYAMNHVHKDAPVYKEHPEWFWPLDYGFKNYCVCGDGCSWDNDEGRRCWFRDYLPDWNFQIPEARKASIDNAVWWIQQTGIDGFRLDAVKHIEFSWISDLRRRLCSEVEPGSGEHFYTVGETFAREDRGLIKAYIGPELMDGQFDFPQRGVVVEKILRRTGSMADLDSFLASNDSFYGPDALMSTFLGNHDIPRVIHAAEDQPWGAWDAPPNTNWTNKPGLPSYKAPFERLAVGYTLMLTTKGIPLIYYGDEIGMPGSADPDNRRFMQWDDYPDSVPYSEGQKFLLDRVKKLGKIRQQYPALWRGTRQTVHVDNDTYVYSRSDGSQILLIALNRSDELRAVKGMPASGTDLLTGQDILGPSVNLPPRSSMVVLTK
jgi:glycosidase